MTDYGAVGLKAGIEIHQQLNTKYKLFCKCPTLLRDTNESTYEFRRYLHPTRSEMGEIDQAALQESRYHRLFTYKAYDVTCLVENDEEPPREINPDAVDTALEIALLLNADIVDKMHTMRKIVIDGSNTAGFQRTALAATGGSVETCLGPVGISVLCLEEEAAQRVSEGGEGVVYSLDRLGIPLVEIGTEPDIKTPEHARETAQLLGMMLRSTGKVKRGIGTIRQDVNVSIAKGARIEVKGVQTLQLVEDVVCNEVERQLALLEIRDELRERSASVDGSIIDVTDVFKDTKSKVIGKALKKKDSAVLAARLKGYGGIPGRKIQPTRTFGGELSDRARLYGVGGLFHTDELPNYGITDDEVGRLREVVKAGDDDCIIIIADEKRRAEDAIKAALERAAVALEGVPEETRRANPDGSTSYLRPLPGAARMYPETDVPPVEITKERIDAIELPELVSERTERYKKGFGLSEEMAAQMARSPNYELFEEITQKYDMQPNISSSMLTSRITELSRENVPIENLTDDHIRSVSSLLAGGTIAKEGIPALLRVMAWEPDKTMNEFLESAGLTAPSSGDIDDIIERIVNEKKDFIMEKGERALGPLMGIAMEELRGKVDGQTVSSKLRERVNNILK